MPPWTLAASIQITMQRDVELKIERRIKVWIVQQEREQRRAAMLRRAAAVRPAPRRQRPRR
jgi:hypothetical protein